MTGKRYYITTMGCWRRHAARFANSHYVALADTTADSAPDVTIDGAGKPATDGALQIATNGALKEDAKILVLVEADEGAHLAFEDDAACEPLPHPLAQKPISDAAQSTLACHGVPPGATTFDAAEALARVHPLLRHRVF